MPFVSRSLLPKYRVIVPRELTSAVPTVYLGMPPLGIGTVKPQLGGEPRYANTANLRGVSVGSVTVSKESTGTKVRGSSGKRSAFRSGKQKGNGKSRNNTASNGSSTASKRRSSGGNSKAKTSSSSSKIRVLRLKNGRKAYMQNGKFIKKP